MKKHHIIFGIFIIIISVWTTSCHNGNDITIGKQITDHGMNRVQSDYWESTAGIEHNEGLDYLFQCEENGLCNNFDEAFNIWIDLVSIKHEELGYGGISMELKEYYYIILSDFYDCLFFDNTSTACLNLYHAFQIEGLDLDVVLNNTNCYEDNTILPTYLSELYDLSMDGDEHGINDWIITLLSIHSASLEYWENYAIRFDIDPASVGMAEIADVLGAAGASLSGAGTLLAGVVGVATSFLWEKAIDPCFRNESTYLRQLYTEEELRENQYHRIWHTIEE